MQNSSQELIVGPCSVRIADRESKDCEFLSTVGVLDLDQFDCSYEEWILNFREATHKAIARGWPGTPDPSEFLTEQQRIEAAFAERLGTPVDLEHGGRVEMRDQGWVVFTKDVWILCYFPACGWTRDEPSGQNLAFETAAKAMAVSLLAERIELARTVNRENAFKVLGRPDPDLPEIAPTPVVLPPDGRSRLRPVRGSRLKPDS